METILFAVLGISPSVLTETVWALTQEKDPVIPDRIVVLTTTIGRQTLARNLFGRDRGWERLVATLVEEGHQVDGKLRFGLASDHVRLFPAHSGDSDLADLVTSADNLAAADFILRELRSFTENPGTRVLASIAGGRKTMSALLMSCMSLLGRKQDRVLHVLVTPPFDTPLDPPFLFPEDGIIHRPRDGEGHQSTGAAIDLIDVPFVRMRGWYEGAFKTVPPGYAALVAGVQRKAPPAAVRPAITFNRSKGTLLIEGTPAVALSAPEAAVLSLQFGGVANHSDMTTRLLLLKKASFPTQSPGWLYDFQESSRFDPRRDSREEKPLSHDEAIATTRRILSGIRKKLRGCAPLAPFLPELLPTQEAETTYSKLRLTGPDPLADIRGYPQ